MSRPVPERLRQLAAEVQQLDVLPAAAVRARGRRRARRQMAGAVVGVAVMATTAGIAATNTLDRPSQGAAAPGPAAVSPEVRCVLTLPPDPAEVRVRVLDGEGHPATATELRKRGFTVLAHTGGTTNSPSGPTMLRYGPAAIGAAALLRAELIGDTVMRFDPARADDSVDLTLGPTFVRLATTTELNQALAELDEPVAPPGC